MQPLQKRILATIERHRMIQPGDRIAAAVSGGGDSVALLFLLQELRQELGVTLTVIHFNHQLRAQAADVDERFVRELAGDRGLECLIRSADVAGEARRTGSNVEEEARKQRYAFFREITDSGAATRIATGHTADDQAETMLARMARGSGLRGMAAIHPVWGAVVRPLIEVRRSELREYLGALGRSWREDETNLDTARLRTRIRRRLLPAMQEEFGAGVVERLGRLAELARRDEALLDAFVEERFESLIERTSAAVAIRAHDLANPWPENENREVREGLATRLTRRAAQEMKRDLRGLTYEHIARVLDLAREGTSGSRLVLPGGLMVERVLDRLFFARKDGMDRTTGRRSSYAYRADPWAEGETVVEIAETGKRVRLKLIDWSAAGRDTYREESGASGALDADRLATPLVIRNWLPGDAYRPHGRGHVEKLKRLLLERRIAGKDRGGWPVLTSAGKPIWSSGLPVAEEYAAGPRTRRALLVSEGKTDSGQSGVVVGAAGPGRASNRVGTEGKASGREEEGTGPERG